MKNLFFLFSFLFLCSFSYAHKFAKFNVVVDSDCGSDDFRAITYFLASKDFNINAITTVDGVSFPNDAAKKFSRLLSLYHHEGIIIGEGENRNSSKKYSSPTNLFWDNFIKNNNNKNNQNYKPAVEVLYDAIKNNNNPTIIVAMGPLSNISELLKTHPEIISKIQYILWYSYFENISPSGYNYETDTLAYNYIAKLPIPLKILFSNNTPLLSDSFYNDCKELNTKYSRAVSNFFSLNNNHKYNLWDDFLPIYIIYPQQFQERAISKTLSLVTTKETVPYENLFLTILNSERRDAGVVFNEIPTSGFLVSKDVLPNVDTIISIYGYDEYKLVALSSEIHSHLGTYSIIGAKMGLRVMEYLHVGLDEIRIESLAGNKPPISCLNDGLQVATGATMGYGAFSVSVNEEIFPGAIIYHNNRKIKISLKEEIFSTIKNDLSLMVQQYGYNTDMYWAELRNYSIEIWKNYNRYDIFDIKEE